MLVIVPSRGRPSTVRRAIDAWTETNAFEVADLLYALDEDDPTLGEYASSLAEGYPQGFLYTVGERLSMAPLTNALARANMQSYWAMGSQGDDHVPRTRNWAQRYMEVLRSQRTGIVYGDDGLQGSRLCTEWMMTSDIVLAVGAMIPAPVEHLYADNSVMLLGHEAGVLRWCPDVHIEHMHYVNRKSPRDAGYDRVNARERWDVDGAAFNRWRYMQMPADVAKVRALL